MKRGFTLIELVVVLLILALVTHLAVRELGKVQRARLGEAANAQLEAVRAAVWQNRPGEEPTGFLVDLGRLPQALVRTNEQGRLAGTLRELWERPAHLAPFALRPAVASNLVVAAAEKATLSDAAVLVPCGWRGPYLRLPFGRDRLVDAWGNPMETPDDAGFARLLDAGGQAAALSAPVARVRHFGADGRLDTLVTPADPAARDVAVELVPGGRLANPLVVNASFVTGTHPAVLTGTARCRWYMPCGGGITGGVATVTLAGVAQASFSLSGLPPGVCSFALDLGTSAAAQQTCARGRTVVPPGGRIVDIKVPVEESWGRSE